MKLAKKVLVFVVAIAVMSTVAFSAFAASTLSVSAPAKVEEGQTFTVTATLGNATGFESGVFQLSWDPAVYQYVSQTNSELGSAVGDKISDGAATVGFMFTKSLEDASLTMATFTFKAIGAAGDKAAFTLEVLDGDFEPAANLPATGSANVEIVAPTTAAPTTEAPTTEAPSVEPTQNNTEAPSEATTAAPTKVAPTTPAKTIPATGDAGIAVAAALVVLAGAAFVASKKSK